VILTVSFFLLACCGPGKRSMLLNGAGVICFSLALTSKEVALATPVYLAVVCVVRVIAAKPGARREQAFRYLRLLAPYFVVLALYLSLHIARMPVRHAEGEYRTEPNIAVILRNARKLPLWVIRVFRYTGDTLFQANELDRPVNSAVGVLLFFLVCAQWAADLRSRPSYWPVLLMLAWMGVFLVVPAYAGGYLWHISLAIPGYAMLVGVAVARLIRAMPGRSLRSAMVLFFVAGLAVLSRANVSATLHKGVHATAYRINSEHLLDVPPVPRSGMPSDALIYIEDRLHIGRWNYGSGELMGLAYLSKTVEEQLVPSIDEVPVNDAVRWLQRKHAYFFRYDSNYNWQDLTREFAARQFAQLTRYTDALFSAGRGKEVPGVLHPFLPALARDGVAHYHYALGLQLQGHIQESFAEYDRSIQLLPTQFFAYYNRARLWTTINRRRKACGDLRQARSLNPNYPGLDTLLKTTCQ
jgi:hypothetical protein